MKRYLFRAFAVIVAFTAVIFSCGICATAASTATASVSLSSTNAYTGETITATVTYSSASTIGAWNFVLNYDASLLEYVSGADKHTSGTCQFANVNMDAANAKSTVSFTVTFKAIATGTATLSTHTSEIVCEDYSKAAVTEGSRKVAISNKPVYVPSDVNTLKSLSVVGFAMEPAFSKDVTEYSLTIEYPTTSVEIAAATESNLATYSVYGANRMDVGDNIVIVTVTAENGDKKKYNIHIKRNESPYKAVTVKPDGHTEMTFPVDATGLEVPEGFRADVSQCDGQDVLSFVNSNGTIRIAALEGISAEGTNEIRWFLFDPASTKFSPYIDYAPGNMRYVLLTPPDDIVVPEGYSKDSLMIGGSELPAFQNPKYDERYYLVYATPVSGSPGLYTYDSLENTMQLYMTYDGIPTESQLYDLQDQLDAEIGAHTADNDKAKKDQEELKNQIADGEQKDKVLLIAAAVFAFLFLVFLILFIVAKAKSGKKNRNTDYLDEEDDIPDLNTAANRNPDLTALNTTSETEFKFDDNGHLVSDSGKDAETPIAASELAPEHNSIEYNEVFFPDETTVKDELQASESNEPLFADTASDVGNFASAADLLAGSVNTEEFAQMMAQAEHNETVRYEPTTGTFTRIPGIRNVPTADDIRRPNEDRSPKAPTTDKAPHSIGYTRPAQPKKKKRSVKTNRAHF